MNCSIFSTNLTLRFYDHCLSTTFWTTRTVKTHCNIQAYLYRGGIRWQDKRAFFRTVTFLTPVRHFTCTSFLVKGEWDHSVYLLFTISYALFSRSCAESFAGFQTRVTGRSALLLILAHSLRKGLWYCLVRHRF